jgi:hypothetical protein
MSTGSADVKTAVELDESVRLLPETSEVGWQLGEDRSVINGWTDEVDVISFHRMSRGLKTQPVGPYWSSAMICFFARSFLRGWTQSLWRF